MFGNSDSSDQQSNNQTNAPVPGMAPALNSPFDPITPTPPSAPSTPFGMPSTNADDNDTGKTDDEAANTSTPWSSSTSDSSSDAPKSKVVDDDLLSIKQEALHQLSPLVGHLEQSPEEKFRTTMMMIQASDDQTLVKAAYEAAQAIPDEKVRAQALLDVVNEINYFTQQHHQA